jgi:hypothetical protein
MKIKRFEESELVIYEFSSLEEAKETIEKWKQDFRRINKIDIIEKTRKDMAYETYAKQLDDMLEFESKKCQKCSEEDVHEK